eukprot:SAG25_NODE_542_length_7058_cov_1.916942_5_plen_95_part_00
MHRGGGGGGGLSTRSLEPLRIVERSRIRETWKRARVSEPSGSPAMFAPRATSITTGAPGPVQSCIQFADDLSEQVGSDRGGIGFGWLAGCCMPA